MKELEVELEKAKQEVQSVRHLGDRRLKEAIGEKTGTSRGSVRHVSVLMLSALEDLVASLRSHVARITAELAEHTALVAELRAAQSAPPRVPSPPQYSKVVDVEVQDLRRDVDRLDKEVNRLEGVVEEGLQTRRKGRGSTETQVDLLGRDEPMGEGLAPSAKPQLPSKLRQGVHASASTRPTTMPPTIQLATRVSHAPPTPDASEEDGYHSPTPMSRSSSGFKTKKDGRSNGAARQARISDASDRSRTEEGPDSPFPSIRAEDEEEFFALSRAAQDATERATNAKQTRPARQSMEDVRARYGTTNEVPPQTVLARVIAELEEDFAHFKACVSQYAC